MHNILQLHAYHVWANDRTCQHLASLPDEVCDAVVQSVFPTINTVLAHIYVIDRGWLAMMQGTLYIEAATASIPLIEETRGMNLSALAARMGELAGEFRGFLERQHDFDTGYAIGSRMLSMADMMQHVVSHGAYHRGNITAMLHQQGQRGVGTDYALYLFEPVA